MKACSKCGEEKPLTGFNRSRRDRDGFRSECRECQAQYYAANSQCMKARSRAYTESHREERKAHNRAYYLKHREERIAHHVREGKTLKGRARRALCKAVSRGKILREPCVVCGNLKSHGHHDDYEQPLKAIWLCSLHHGLLHQYLNDGGDIAEWAW